MKRSKLILTLGASSFLAVSASAEKKPNVVFIFADDFTYNAMANLGDDYVFTPNLDRLRNSGAYFSHAFNQGSYSAAVSVASRAMLNTGKYLWRATNAVGQDLKFQKDQWPAGAQAYQAAPKKVDKLWSDYMSDAGYETYMTGKWHVPFNTAEVFDNVGTVRAGMPKTHNDAYAYNEKTGKGRHFDPNKQDDWTSSDASYGGYWEGGKHWSEVVADEALGFISDATSKDDPYFMYLAFNAPHDPRQAPQEYLDMYKPEQIAIPENFMPTYPYHVEIGCDYHSLRDEKLAPGPRTEYSIQVNRRDYYALITHLDVQIGRILDALEAAGQMDDTYIIFTADHGLAVGDHGLLGKQNMYDASMRVPLIVAGPGVKARKIAGKVYLQDAMATALDIADSKDMDKVDFKSLLSLAEGAKTSSTVNEAVYGAYMGQQRMVRNDKYKMLIYPTANVVRLYDIKKDPRECVDLASNPKYRKVMDGLLEELKVLQKNVDDPLDVQPYYDNFFSAL